MPTANPKLRRLQAASLAEQAYFELKEAILAGELAPGTALAETELADAMGISRTPVREALALLRRDGLVIQQPNASNVVRVLTDDEVRELFLIREALEGVAVREFIAHTADAASVAALRAILDAQRAAMAAGDVDGFLGADEEFHLTVCRRAGLEHVTELLAALRDRIRQAGLAAITAPERMAVVIDEHAAVVAALEARDPGAAEDAIRAHLSATQTAYGRRSRGDGARAEVRSA